MIHILITGANSYIGTSVEKWVLQKTNSCCIDTLDMKSEEWKNKSFSQYDVVFHVAGIAHVSSDPKLKDLYFKVNRDLTVETAKKAKSDGVKQFIFMSSIIVYGSSARIGKEKRITSQTKMEPADFYGQSKLEAEEGLLALENDDFKVAIIRPPMIYGKGSKGNYSKLSRMAQRFPLFPKVNNSRSMLYIDNLCEFVRLLIRDECRGIFYPQNREYVNTSEMVKRIAACHNRKMYLTKIFNPVLYLSAVFVGIVNKVFGNLTYEKEMSENWNFEYCVVDFEESIKQTEG